VFARVYNKLREIGVLASSHISSEPADQQNADKVKSNLQSAERSPSTSTRRISTHIGVPHITVGSGVT
jgi:hypothetical protein